MNSNITKGMAKVKKFQSSWKNIAFNITWFILGILFDEEGKIIFEGEFENNKYWNGKGNLLFFLKIASKLTFNF